MKKGDKVEIFEDPITKTRLEGVATLIELEFSDPHNVPPLEYWRVRFDVDSPGEYCSRTISIDGTGESKTTEEEHINDLRYMITFHDPEGKARAYGVAVDEESARRVAQDQIMKYRARKREVEDFELADCAYTEQVNRVE